MNPSRPLGPPTLPGAFPKPDPKCALHVGNISKKVNEGYLTSIFSTVGNVQSVKICRDTISRVSLGHGYVNFAKPEEAESAIDKLNYHVIDELPIRITRVRDRSDPTVRNELQKGNVFVNNLDEAIQEKDLNETFKCFGDIISCKVARDSRMKPLGYGYVHFKKADAAARAIEKVNGIMICNKKITCQAFQSRKDRSQERTNIYAKEYPMDWTEEELNKFFEKFGKITSLFYPKDLAGNHKGFCMVNFENKDEAAKSLEANGSTLKGKDGTETKIYVAYSQSKDERRRRLKREYADQATGKRACSVIVKWHGPLAAKIDEDALTEIFGQFGNIASVKIPKIGKGQDGKGFAFINCRTRDDCQAMIANGHMKSLAGLNWMCEMQLSGKGAKMNGPQPIPGLGLGAAGMWPFMGGKAPMMIPQQQAMMMQMQQHQMMGGMPTQQGMFPRAPQGNIAGGSNATNGGMSGLPSPPAMKRMQRNFDHGTSLNPQDLAQVDAATQKQMIGETLYPLVQQRITKTECAGKITGMILEMDNTEVLMLFDNQAALNEKIGEACSIIGQGCELLRQF